MFAPVWLRVLRFVRVYPLLPYSKEGVKVRASGQPAPLGGLRESFGGTRDICRYPYLPPL